MAEKPKTMFEVSEMVIGAFNDIVSECIHQGVDGNKANDPLNVVAGLILVATEIRLLRESIDASAENVRMEIAGVANSAG